MSLQIKFKIVTPERTVFESDVDQATLPVTDGEVTILPNHIPYIASLKAGEIILKTAGKDTALVISGGYIEFSNNTLTILADTAERAEEIDLARAEEAKKRAEDLKKQAILTDETEYAKVALAIEKEIARIKVGKKHRHSKTINIQ